MEPNSYSLTINFSAHGDMATFHGVGMDPFLQEVAFPEYGSIQYNRDEEFSGRTIQPFVEAVKIAYKKIAPRSATPKIYVGILENNRPSTVGHWVCEDADTNTIPIKFSPY